MILHTIPIYLIIFITINKQHDGFAAIFSYFIAMFGVLLADFNTVTYLW